MSECLNPEKNLYSILKSIQDGNTTTAHISQILGLLDSIEYQDWFESATIENSYPREDGEIAVLVQNLAALTNDSDLVALFSLIGRFYQAQGLYAIAEFWYQQCLSVVEKRLGNKHQDFAISLHNLAKIYFLQERYIQAEPLLLQALEFWCLEQENLNAAISYSLLGETYYAQQRYEQAEPLLQKALEIRLNILGEDHPDIATSLNNLAGLYDSQKCYEQAEPLYQKALELRRKLLGEEHPDVATSLNNLAGLYDSQQRYEEAEPLYKQALELKRRQLGNEHPYVAISLNNLAGMYQEQKRYEQAQALYEQALEIFAKSLGANHPYTITCSKNLENLCAKGRKRYRLIHKLWKLISP
ncbi:MAG: tetratricopeptide repeat protein [Calothrix sp. C42_A2020_038]|nr:tetratricopeptide repeat protein [Calothrix sp. C42_A2020_038]